MGTVCREQLLNSLSSFFAVVGAKLDELVESRLAEYVVIYSGKKRPVKHPLVLKHGQVNDLVSYPCAAMCLVCLLVEKDSKWNVLHREVIGRGKVCDV